MTGLGKYYDLVNGHALFRDLCFPIQILNGFREVKSVPVFIKPPTEITLIKTKGASLVLSNDTRDKD